MITEDYCSYEVSNLLKEKGFEGICDYAYSNKGNYFEIDRSNFDEVYCLRPTLQMAMKWLREVHNKHAQIEYNLHLSWYYDIIDLKEKDFHDYDDTKHWHYECDFKSYEEAVEAALLYILENLI